MEGTKLGPYELLSELGSGGMGKVFKAEVTGAVPGLEPGCAVALKVIHAHLLETPGFFKRFLREADLGRTIEHENVVRTFDCDALLHEGQQQNFLVMEYVEGQTLRDLLHELDRVPEELCGHIGREVAKGLAAIHEAGVVHRDLKPENVLITADHVVKIMDLGVARLQAEAIRLSQTGAFVGSLEYAAPEQFRSSDGEPDGRADLHALGVVLYELATGQHPYRDKDASRVIGRILNDQPRKAGEVNPQLSPFFEEVVHTLIAKDRGERFPAASDLAGVLDKGEKSEWWKARAKALRVETKRPLRRIRIPRETALYGRDDDLAKLHGLYEMAKAGDGQVLLIEGEAGIGKTRLVDEFVGRLRQEGEDINFVFGSYPPGGAATAAGAFSEAYREQFGADGLEDTLAEYIKPTPILIPAFAAILKGETTPNDAEPLTKDSLQTVFVHATRGLAAERTTIVLIDDLHFAPEDGRALFTSLGMAVPGHRIFLVGTMRPGVSEEWTAGITRLDHAEQRSLARLGPKDLFRLLKDSFRSDRLAEELGLRISVKCDGNPFFAFEIIRGLREGQFISRQPDGRWVTTRAIEDIQVPSSVLDLVKARVADLTDDERNFLDVASCLGFEFDSRVVAGVLGLARIPALRMLAKIEKKHRLVRSAGDRFEFDHHQVQEGLYGALSKPLREAYHAALAEALEAVGAAADKDPDALAGTLSVDLCEHFLKGARGEQALRYLPAAQTRLTAGNLHARVVTLTEGVLAVPALLTGTQRAKTLLRLTEALDALGRRDRQEECAKEADRLAETAGDAALRGQAVTAIGSVCWTTARIEEAEAAFRQALALAQGRGDRSAEARATANLGLVLWSLSRLPEARAHQERCLALSREMGDQRAEAAALGNLGLVFQSEGRMQDAREHYERHLAFCREFGSGRGEARATMNLGLLHQTEGHLSEARAHHERSLALSTEIGDRQGEARSTSSLGTVFQGEGRLREAQDLYERSLALSREVGDLRSVAIATGNLGLILHSMGRLREARRHSEVCRALSRDIGYLEGEANALHSLGNLSHEEGASVRAEEDLLTCLSICEQTGEPRGTSWTNFSLGRIRAATGGGEEARGPLAAARDKGAEFGLAAVEMLARCELALLPGGDTRDALAAFCEHEERLNAAQRYEARFLLWKATGDPVHLREAKRLLDHIVEHAPEEYRESMLENVRLHREIMEAWEERGEEA